MKTRTHDTFTTNVQRFLITLTLLIGLSLASVGASAQDVTLDTDADGLIDEQELEIGTDPNNSDSDTDRLSDGFEVREYGTDPLRADSDEDGLGDGDELEVYKTDPLSTDSDGDGFDDATEVDAGSDPADFNSIPRKDTSKDTDGDGLLDDDELQIGTDPNKTDTDVDRLSDGFEVLEYGSDPLRADTDEDGLGDGDELEVYKTDALSADTDGDGVDDATEIDAGTDPRDASSYPSKDAVDPTPAAAAVKPVTSLPNTGVGTLASADADVAPIAILLAGALLTSLLGAFKVMGSRSA